MDQQYSKNKEQSERIHRQGKKVQAVTVHTETNRSRNFTLRAFFLQLPIARAVAWVEADMDAWISQLEVA